MFDDDSDADMPVRWIDEIQVVTVLLVCRPRASSRVTRPLTHHVLLDCKDGTRGRARIVAYVLSRHPVGNADVGRELIVRQLSRQRHVLRVKSATAGFATIERQW